MEEFLFTEYIYDWSGRRIGKDWYGGYETRYVYGGDNLIAEYVDGDLVRKFIYGPGIDFPIMMIDVDGETETKYYYLHDAHGSVIALLNNSGTIVEAYSYGPYGESKINTDILPDLEDLAKLGDDWLDVA